MNEHSLDYLDKDVIKANTANYRYCSRQTASIGKLKTMEMAEELL
jgi:hypothetical protein